MTFHSFDFTRFAKFLFAVLPHITIYFLGNPAIYKFTAFWQRFAMIYITLLKNKYKFQVRIEKFITQY